MIFQNQLDGQSLAPSISSIKNINKKILHKWTLKLPRQKEGSGLLSVLAYHYLSVEVKARQAVLVTAAE